MPEPRKLRVFLCHASQDKPIVRELYQRLLAEGWIDPWLDEEKLLPGQDWDMEIKKAVEVADAVIVFLSNSSVTKEGYIQKEIRNILDVSDQKPEGAIFVIPLRLQECEPPRRLQPWQYTDYFPEHSRDKAYSRLKTSLQARAYGVGINVDSLRWAFFSWDKHPEILQKIVTRIIAGQSMVVVGETEVNNISLLQFLFSESNSLNLITKSKPQLLFQYINILKFGTSITTVDFWRLALEPILRLNNLSNDDLSKVCQACEINEYDFFELEQLFNKLTELKLRLVVFVERFDLLVALSIPDRVSFYRGLRSLASRFDSLVLVYSSRQSVSDFNFVTRGLNPQGSPFFNTMLEIRIPSLNSI